MVRRRSKTAIVFFLSFWFLNQVSGMQDPPSIRVNTDQLVYVAGEEIWVDGMLPSWDIMPQIVYIRMISRKGEVMLEKQLYVSERYFDGYLETSYTLPSDYYFIDCVVRGYATHIRLQPVLIVNPQIPPSGPCTYEKKLPTNLRIHSSLSIEGHRKIYAHREAVNFQLTSGLPGSMANVYVRRSDGLSALMDTLVSVYEPSILHKATGPIEAEGHHISVRVTAAASGVPARQLTVIAAVSGEGAKLSTSITDASGVAEFILPILRDDRNLVFSVMEPTGASYQFNILQQNETISPIDFPCLSLDESYRADIEARMFQAAMMKKFHGRQLIQDRLESDDSTDFYGRPDQRYMLDDYTRFPNMEEILGEFVPEVRVRNSGSEEVQLQILNLPYKKYFSVQGLILLDGVPVNDIKNLLAMDPLLLKSIDVIPREYYLGKSRFGGVVQYKSYKKDLAGYRLGSGYYILPYAGVQHLSDPVFFLTQRVETTKPDLRNLLWREIRRNITDKQPPSFTFTTGDAKAKYEIVVLTFSDNSHTSVARSVFTVE